MNINRIISEEIHNFLKEEFLFEDNKEKNIRHNAIKRKGGRRGDFNAKLDKETNPNLNNGDNEEIARALDNDIVNVAAVARQLYPNLTPEGAQSKLRKKIKHIKRIVTDNTVTCLKILKDGKLAAT